MKIYRLYTKDMGYKHISYDNSPLIDSIGEENWTNISEITSFNYHWTEDDKGKQSCDCPFLIGAIPVFRTEALAKIDSSFYKNTVDIIHIKVENEDYCILKARHLISNILDEKKSKLSRFPDGRIMYIDKYVLKTTDSLPSIFKLSEFPLFTFVTENFAKILINLEFTGLKLEECELK